MKEIFKKLVVEFLALSRINRLFHKATVNKSLVYMFHRFYDPSIGYLSDEGLKPDLLESFIKFLIKQKFNILSLDEFVSAILCGSVLSKTVVFTIDDGYIDVKNVAFPVFRKYQIPFTVFITTDFVSGKQMMWWDQVEYVLNNTSREFVFFSDEGEGKKYVLNTRLNREAAILEITEHLKKYHLREILKKIKKLSKELGVNLPERPPVKYSALSWEDVRDLHRQGVDFQPHTVTHPILARLSPDGQEYEIRESIRTMKREIGKQPQIFCYPNGLENDYDKNTMYILKEEGIRAAFTAVSGYVGISDRSGVPNFPYQLPRVAIPSVLEHFALDVSGVRGFQAGLIQKLKRMKWPNHKLNK